jgi:uncharacterized membrane protein
MARQKGRFEMRRLETLSNTIFGVAMTLLAYDIPKARIVSDVPNWETIWHVYASPLLALIFSFIVAGIFWFSHQRRLAYAPEGNRIVVFLNLMFLLSIILLPVTSGLYGAHLEASAVTALYGDHLALISALNLTLWLMVVTPNRDWSMIGGPVFATLVFSVTAIIALFAPYLAKFLWPLAFAAPVVASFFERAGRQA